MDQVILYVGVVVVGVFGLLGIGFVRQPAYRRLGVADFVRASLQRVADAVANVLDSDRGRVSRLVRGVGAAVLAQSARTSAGTFTLPGSVVVFSGASDYAVLAGEPGESVVRSVNQELSGLPNVVGASQMEFRLDESLSPGQVRVLLPGDVEVASGVVGVVSRGYVGQDRTTDVLVGAPEGGGQEAPTKVDRDLVAGSQAGLTGGSESVTSHLESACPQVLSVSGEDVSRPSAGVSPESGGGDGMGSADEMLPWGVEDVEGDPTEQPAGRDVESVDDGDVDTAEPGIRSRVADDGDVELGSDGGEAALRNAGGAVVSSGPGVVPVTEATPVVRSVGAPADVDSGVAGGDSTKPLSRCFVIGPDGQSYALSRAGLIVGRSPECDIVVQDVHASAKHARFSLTSAGVRVEDLGATNGVLVNQRLVQGSAELRSEDNVIIGQTIYRVESVGLVGGN